MKKIRKTSNLLLVLVLVLSGCSGEAPVGIQKALVLEASGEAFVKGAKEAGGANVQARAIKNGQVLSSGDTLRTGKNSYVQLIFPGGELARIMEDTVVKLDEVIFMLDQDLFRVRLGLAKGEVFVVTEQLTGQSAFDIITPASIASVRGTEFSTEHEEDQTTIRVNDGSVNVEASATKDRSIVEEGQTAVVDRDGTFSISRWNARDRLRIERVREQMKTIKEKYSEDQKSIRERFESEKEEMKKIFEDQKTSDRKMFEAQTEKSKQEFQKVSDENKKSYDELSKELDGLSDEMESAGRSAKEQTDDSARREFEKTQDSNDSLDQSKLKEEMERMRNKKIGSPDDQ